MPSTQEVETLIADLLDKRLVVADRNATLAGMDEARAALKATIVAELTAGGMAVTPAGTAASRDPRMTAQTAERIAREQARDYLSAEAENLRFRVKLALIERQQDILLSE